MASTSLKDQLRRLQVPQTTTIHDVRQRSSLLFDPKEAATKERRTIFELGLSGLRELITLDPAFQQFKHTLFDETTIDFERAVEQSEVNRLLDANIAKFLQNLSPYLLLRPAHLCIEWLLRRFHVHEYNKDALLALALPYYETNVFVRILQTLPLRNLDSWLHSVKKTGLPLSKTVLYNHAAKERAFLNFVCQHNIDIVHEFKQRAHLLQAQLNFYATTVVGALEHASHVGEWHITTILPSLLKGFGSEIPDVVSASFIITAQLVARTQLTPKLGNALIKRVASVSLESLQSATVLLMNWIFEAQHVQPPLEFADDTLYALVQQKWLTQLLATFARDNVSVQGLITPLLRQSIDAIQMSHEDANTFKLFLQRFIFDVSLSVVDAHQFIRVFLDSLDTEMETVDLEFEDWYKDYLKQLEHQYPEAFDLAVKEALFASSDDDTAQRSSALKMALSNLN